MKIVTLPTAYTSLPSAKKLAGDLNAIKLKISFFETHY